MREQFEEIKVEVVLFENEDVITASEPDILDGVYEDDELNGGTE